MDDDQSTIREVAARRPEKSASIFMRPSEWSYFPGWLQRLIGHNSTNEPANVKKREHGEDEVVEERAVKREKLFHFKTLYDTFKDSYPIYQRSLPEFASQLLDVTCFCDEEVDYDLNVIGMDIWRLLILSPGDQYQEWNEWWPCKKEKLRERYGNQNILSHTSILSAVTEDEELRIQTHNAYERHRIRRKVTEEAESVTSSE